ncbi:MAG: 5'-nucleotidase, lipoprotein e(P4) family [Calditrichia bacterium]
MKKILFILAVFLLAGCASSGHNNLNSTLWMQTAAEYQASTRQTFKAAEMQLANALKDSSWTSALEQGSNFRSKPPAIILDVDETVLDNSPYQASNVLNNKPFEFAGWDAWVSKSAAKAIPGAAEFLSTARSLGVAVIFLTNRECSKRPNSDEDCPQHEETLLNLHSAGLLNAEISATDRERLLIKKQQKDWGSEKKTRRAYVAETYRIIMLFGDDLGDFLPDVKKNITADQRAKLVADNSAKWGSSWFVLPNPTYGSWQRVLPQPMKSNLRTQ